FSRIPWLKTIGPATKRAISYASWMAHWTLSCRLTCSGEPARMGAERTVDKMRRAGPVLSALVMILATVSFLQPARAEEKITVNNELNTKNVRKEECNLADVIVDAIRDSANTEVAFVAASSFAEHTVPKGSAGAE